MANEEDFASMLAEFEGSASGQKRKRPRAGDMVSGKVISIGKDSVFIDVGGKAEGVLDRNQIADADGNVKVKVGDAIEARVVADAGGVLELRIKVARGPEAKAELVTAFELGLPVDGLVTEVVKGGLSVDVAGVRGFCPASQVDNRFVADLAVFVGQRLTFKITKYEPGQRGNLVLNRRVLAEEEAQKKAAEMRHLIVPGAVVKGTVSSLQSYGAFVDLGGIEGMLHVSELGFGRVGHPEEVLKVGQPVEVQVLRVEPDPKGKGERIALSLKALANDPWNDAANGISVGARLKGKISKLQPFGAFVEIAPGVEGLVHISELGAGRRINHPKEFVEIGQEVEVQVLQVDLEKRRIGLSMGASADGSAEDVSAAMSTMAGPASSAKLGTFADLLAKFKK